MRYFLKLAYQGTNYSGWQRQVNTPHTVQETIEIALSKMLDNPIIIHGCGRTDAGVHATEYYVHLDIETLPTYDFISRINHILPDAISVSELIKVNPNANVQHDAKWRTYEYYFHLIKTPKLNHTSSYYNYDDLDFDKMDLGIEIIKSTKDFRSLCKHPDLYKNTECIIKDARLDKLEGLERYKFTIIANRFLRGMIRYMIARLLDIGEGKLKVDDFEKQLNSKQSFEFPYHKQGHPQGLYLSKIDYPDSILNN
ncbi:MAG: tRNA pseudouridine38-40 synthase [Saprospiraceae bacterium]|jgi:tRNA pseudouridine38-40 synthase